MKRTLLAVHAHPDDEVIGTGGTMARYSALGAHVALVCATRGEVGEIVEPTMDDEATRSRLGEVREGELRAAADVLGIHELHFLGYRDSGMAGTADNNNPMAFWRADIAEATSRLARVIRLVRPDVIVTYNENGGYGHPDHIMAHRITVAAFDAAADPAHKDIGGEPWQAPKLYYTAFPRSFLDRIQEMLRQAGKPSPFDRPDLKPEKISTPDEQITTRIDARDFLAQKQHALACHRTQIAADSFFFKMPEEWVREGLGFEHFVRVRSTVEVPGHEDDLFSGLDEAAGEG